MLILLMGIFFGTYGLAWAHHLVHKYNLFYISIIWRYHKLHHLINDPEQPNRQRYSLPLYGLVSSLKYFNLLKWTLLDWVVVIVGIIYPTLGLSFLVGIFISENIGYLQHTYEGTPVNFTNKFDNLIGLSCGMHAKHHNKESNYNVNTEVIFGLTCAYVWLIICVILYPFLLFSFKRSNIPGAYLFGFFQNLANYRAIEGRSIRSLIYRMPSVFDKPILLWQYLRIIFRKECVKGIVNTGNIYTNKLYYSHEVSNIRNIYNYKAPQNNKILIYHNQIIEGHHRYAAKSDNMQYYTII